MIDRPQLLDRAHLDAQTFGDRDLAREVLGLFEGQLARLPPIIGGDGQRQQARIDAAHTLKGSARGVGAARIAACAEACEQALRDGRVIEAELAALEAAAAETRAEIARAVAENAATSP